MDVNDTTIVAGYLQEQLAAIAQAVEGRVIILQALKGEVEELSNRYSFLEEELAILQGTGESSVVHL